MLFSSLLNNKMRARMRTPAMAPRTPAMIAVVFAFCVELVVGVVVLVVAGLGVVVLAVARLGVVVLAVAGLGVVVLFSEVEDEVELDD